MKTLKQIRCKNCESYNHDCDEDYETTNCEMTPSDVREWLNQKLHDFPQQFPRSREKNTIENAFIFELMEELGE